MESPELERSEVHVPDSVVDLLEPHVFPGTDDRDVDPLRVPAYPAVGADVAHLEAIGVFERRESARHLARRGRVDTRRGLLLEGFVGSFMIELLAKAVELPLLRWQVAGRGLWPRP